MKKLSLGLAAAAFVLSFAAAIPKSTASAYEWLTNFIVSPQFGISSNRELKVYRTINTSSSYEEYRTAYYQVSSTYDQISPSDPNWIEWTECRAHSVVSTPVDDQCFPHTPSAPGSSLLHILVTTNFAGCGTYTPNPSANCGDTTSTIAYYAP